jgi:hypothetical protein
VTLVFFGLFSQIAENDENNENDDWMNEIEEE